MVSLTLLAHCGRCDWEWVGRKRADPKEPDPDEMKRSHEAWIQHAKETDHDAVVLGLRETRTFRFDGRDAPSLKDIVMLAERGGVAIVESLERIRAVSEPRRQKSRQRPARPQRPREGAQGGRLETGRRMTPACGYCGAEFGKATDAEAHGLTAHSDDDVIYYEGDFPDVALLAARRR